MNDVVPKLVRCAVYTRKSTEHNLDLAFTSLDAQREACEAYIRSQAGEGWRLLGERYDDGGLSGASLDRPALQALLAAVRARKVDVLVVYKVDRLTRNGNGPRTPDRRGQNDRDIYEVRDANNYFEEIPDLTPAPELLRLAEHILDSKLAAFDPSAFRDRYEEALMAHLKAKHAGLPPQPKQSWAAPRRAINLMEALRRSIAADKPAAPRQPAPARKRA
jgi:Resolvase, N terminal domain